MQGVAERGHEATKVYLEPGRPLKLVRRLKAASRGFYEIRGGGKNVTCGLAAGSTTSAAGGVGGGESDSIITATSTCILRTCIILIFLHIVQYAIAQLRCAL